MSKMLTAVQVRNLKSDGRHPVGGGLYLVIDGVRRRWSFRYQVDGKRREMGLGSVEEMSLADARAKASNLKSSVRGGLDPIEARRAEKVEAIEIPTFGAFADALVKDIELGFRNEKHRAQWSMTIGDAYCKPIRSKRIDMITTEDVLTVLKPVWITKAETASRLRGRIERILDAAKAKGLRDGENPARWRGHLSNLLPKRQKLQRGHHPAVPFDQVAGVVERLREVGSVSALALEFTILTAARTSETLLSTWREIDLESKVWTIPAPKMKAGREHRVPLTDRCVEILQVAAKLRSNDDPGAYVFPGMKRAKPLSSMSMLMMIRRFGVKDVDGKSATVHGFRSSFRDWAGETTSFPRETIEAALSHVIGDATERAYRRGDALEKRRSAMAAWERFIEPTKDENIIELRR